MVLPMVSMVVPMGMVLLAILSVEGEGVGKRPSVPCSVSVSPQGTSSETSCVEGGGVDELRSSPSSLHCQGQDSHESKEKSEYHLKSSRTAKWCSSPR